VNSGALAVKNHFMNKLSIHIKDNSWIYKNFAVTRALYLVACLVISQVRYQSIKKIAICQWDCKWYTRIAMHGYEHVPLSIIQPGAASWHFLPFVPISSRFIHAITRIGYVGSGVVLSNIAFLGFLLIINKYVSNEYNPEIARTITLLFCYSPLNIYINSMYTEGSYIFLLILATYYSYQKKWLRAAIAISICSITRHTGLFLVFVLAFYYLKANGKNKLTEMFAYICISFIPFELYCLYLFFHTGDALAFLHIGRAWGLDFKNPLTVFESFLSHPSLYQTLNWLVVIFSLILSAFLAVKRDWVSLIIQAPITIWLLSVSLVNYRYVLALYPTYLVLATYLQGRNRRKYIFMAINAFVAILTTYAWLIGNGAMI
jgi:Gpi18-like mannosyltransferase